MFYKPNNNNEIIKTIVTCTDGISARDKIIVDYFELPSEDILSVAKQLGWYNISLHEILLYITSLNSHRIKREFPNCLCIGLIFVNLFSRMSLIKSHFPEVHFI